MHKTPPHLFPFLSLPFPWFAVVVCLCCLHLASLPVLGHFPNTTDYTSEYCSSIGSEMDSSLLFPFTFFQWTFLSLLWLLTCETCRQGISYGGGTMESWNVEPAKPSKCNATETSAYRLFRGLWIFQIPKSRHTAGKCLAHWQPPGICSFLRQSPGISFLYSYVQGWRL